MNEEEEDGGDDVPAYGGSGGVGHDDQQSSMDFDGFVNKDGMRDPLRDGIKMSDLTGSGGNEFDRRTYRTGADEEGDGGGDEDEEEDDYDPDADDSGEYSDDDGDGDSGKSSHSGGRRGGGDTDVLYDKDGVPFYIDREGQRVDIEVYYDRNGDSFFFDEDGEKVYASIADVELDEAGGPTFSMDDDAPPEGAEVFKAPSVAYVPPFHDMRSARYWCGRQRTTLIELLRANGESEDVVESVPPVPVRGNMKSIRLYAQGIKDRLTDACVKNTTEWMMRALVGVSQGLTVGSRKLNEAFPRNPYIPSLRNLDENVLGMDSEYRAIFAEMDVSVGEKFRQANPVWRCVLLFGWQVLFTAITNFSTAQVANIASVGLGDRAGSSVPKEALADAMQRVSSSVLRAAQTMPDPTAKFQGGGDPSDMLSGIFQSMGLKDIVSDLVNSARRSRSPPPAAPLQESQAVPLVHAPPPPPPPPVIEEVIEDLPTPDDSDVSDGGEGDDGHYASTAVVESDGDAAEGDEGAIVFSHSADDGPQSMVVDFSRV